MSKKLTQQEFVQKASKIHNNRYNYSKTVYVSSGLKVKIECPVHGIFLQTAADHVYGEYGCPKCKFEHISKIRVEKAKHSFIEKANRIHNNKFDYSNVEYTNAKKHVKIICIIHGAFIQTPNVHLRGVGCAQCKRITLSTLKLNNQNDVIKSFKKVHKNKFDYSKVLYTGYNNNVEIICPTHGIFNQCPASHLNGSGCLKCSSTISKSEQVIIDWLLKSKIDFVTNKTFNDLRGQSKNSRLRFDFWLSERQTLIEYDGEHHFYPVRSRGLKTMADAEHRHLIFKQNDRKKNRYAKKKGYRLIRIPFTEKQNIDKILTEQLLS
jgi:very-short-patch-repair endonuclease/phage FluMu protein Com